MMSNPCISRHMFGPLPRLQTSGRFAGVGTFFAFWGDFGSEPHGAEVERTITVY